MADEIEVSIDPEKKDETPVSFIETDGDLEVHVGEKKADAAPSDDRIRAAEEGQRRLAQNFDDLRSRLTGGGGNPQPTHSPGPDPWKGQEEAITQQERALGIEWEAHKAARTLTPERLDQFDAKSRALQQQRMDISAQRAIQQAIPRITEMNQRQQFQQEYSDVWNNPNANRWARGHYDTLVAQGAPETPETVRQAMNAARVTFRMAGARSAPTEHDRQQFTGFPGTRRNNMDPKSNVVKMGKSEKIMAMAMYGDRNNGDEKKSYAQWAKGPGIRAQKAMQKARTANR
jgi:hypothetical protein